MFLALVMIFFQNLSLSRIEKNFTHSHSMGFSLTLTCTSRSTLKCGLNMTQCHWKCLDRGEILEGWGS